MEIVWMYPNAGRSLNLNGLPFLIGMTQYYGAVSDGICQSVEI